MTTMGKAGTEALADNTIYDVVVIGAGFSGLYMLHRVRALGFSALVLEAGSDVGGTWYWNRYPGARCDTESVEYSYSFSEDLQQEWSWTERYSGQAEILAYVNHVADRFDLRRDIRFNTRVKSAIFEDETDRWTIHTEKEEAITARICVTATGCLSSPRVPDYKGLSTFKGNWYHTGQWPKERVDFTGARVGVIGTGSTGIQAIPVIAESAAHVYVFQRTANFTIPARNHPLSPERIREVKANYPQMRQRQRRSALGYALYDEIPDKSALAVPAEERSREYQRRWEFGGSTIGRAYNDTITNREANDTVAEFVCRKIREIVKDPEVAEKLIPRGYAIGTKRLPIDTHYFETFNRENVTLVDVRSAPIEEITPGGLRTANAIYELDCIVFATGYDAVTGPLLAIDFRGRQGLSLAAIWAAGPRSYLGLAIAGFPNLFTITGPGSPSVLSNMVVSIEQHVDWIAACIAYMRQHGHTRIEADEHAEEKWAAHVNEVASRTLYVQTDSWYLGANIPGKPRVFLPYIGGVGTYRSICDEVTAKGYEGFVMSGKTRDETAGDVALHPAKIASGRR